MMVAFGQGTTQGEMGTGFLLFGGTFHYGYDSLLLILHQMENIPMRVLRLSFFHYNGLGRYTLH
jgi:hypothetical protein